tara:strand:+ start:10673 stop:11590 length:918 start_codon:yes stop_codon:yes gene_type:complete
MTTTTRLLFSHLPPELRNEVFDYLSAPGSNSTATVTGLPLKLKSYECKHTTVQICPIHYGSKGLLALQSYGFQEAREYSSWLLNNATELKIGVVFKGRVNTFVQQDWDKKMEAHLRKLAKLHPWLKKVAKYDIQILWSPLDGVLKSRKNKRTAGRILRDVVGTLTSLTDSEVKKRRGDVNVKLRLTHDVALETVRSGTRFGLADFLAPTENASRRQKLEVWKEAHARMLPETGARFVQVVPVKKEEIGLLEVDKGRVKWVDSTGRLVMEKYMVNNKAVELITQGEGKADADIGYVVASLVGECLA